jgi:hypothetical protein
LNPPLVNTPAVKPAAVNTLGLKPAGVTTTNLKPAAVNTQGTKATGFNAQAIGAPAAQLPSGKPSQPGAKLPSGKPSQVKLRPGEGFVDTGIEAVTVLMMEYLKTAQKEVHEDRKLARDNKQLELDMKSGKLNLENQKIDQMKQEAGERYDQTMSAAQTELTVGIIGGLVQTGAGVAGFPGGATTGPQLSPGVLTVKSPLPPRMTPGGASVFSTPTASTESKDSDK